MSAKYLYIDLFAGAGGLSEGFVRNGFEPIAHVEIDTAACNTLKTRTAYHHLKATNRYETYVRYLKGELSRTELYSFVPENLLNSIINLPISEEHNAQIHERIQQNLKNRSVDLIIGGPPCQAYSLVGRARSKNGMSGDPRNFLYVQYARYLEKYNPKLFVFENVIGLKSAKGGLYLDNMKKLFDKKGFHIKLFTVEANKFGVLQNRRRVIIIGWNKAFDFDIPDLEAINLSNDKYTVQDLLTDLPKLQAGEGKDKYVKYEAETTEFLERSSIRNGIDTLTQHLARPQSDQDKEIYKIAVEKWNTQEERLHYNDLPDRLKTHKNRSSFFDRFKVVASNKTHSQTVVAHIAKDGHYYIHPDLSQNRSLTIREAARLQSFPDDYYFEGIREGVNRTPAFKQIGNAVPPLMAQMIAHQVKKILN